VLAAVEAAAAADGDGGEAAKEALLETASAEVELMEE